jgi:hypothetical protein
MGREKYILQVNKARIDAEVADLNKQVKALNQKETLYAELSKKTGEEIRSLVDLESYLRNKTGFVNLLLAGQALDLESEYKQAIELDKVEVIAKGKIEKRGGTYVIKQSVIDQVRESYTDYIPEELRVKYDQLEAAIKILNDLPLPNRGCVSQNYSGDWVINKHRFIAK